MGDLAVVFRDHNIDTTEAEIEAVLLQALDEQAPVALDALGDISTSEIEALESVGIRVNGTPAGKKARILSAARYTEMVSSSLSTSAAAALLGVSESRVRQKISARQLYALDNPAGERGHLLPIFQFHARKPIPGFAIVLGALPMDLHPLAARSFLLTPASDLADGEGKAQSPRDWLIGGGSPNAVAVIARHL